MARKRKSTRKPPTPRKKKDESIPDYALIHDEPRRGWVSLGNGCYKRSESHTDR